MLFWEIVLVSVVLENCDETIVSVVDRFVVYVVFVKS